MNLEAPLGKWDANFRLFRNFSSFAGVSVQIYLPYVFAHLFDWFSYSVAKKLPLCFEASSGSLLKRWILKQVFISLFYVDLPTLLKIFVLSYINS